ncbi:E3 ubiquitin-protein ligase TRIM39-like [Sphaeramia orbicularis]|uniref:E3 ubiquitin-protein ligase TRIM39-like n=1 Tax=Sphaeramia orbicularis TaxID=375764 RepID=A0A673CA63_9TELE|nr:E3 ubiquitin-protein ligase TRIM39-like [Sphaeramia orbicularis]
MAAASCVRSEDQFLCSICLDVFTDPVSTPCGHNFCKTCISEHWRVNVPYKCPMCNEEFYIKPQLKINTFIKEMVAQFRLEVQHEPNIYSSDQQAAKPGEVPCDVCTETKLKAQKSCLVCLISYCRTHLEPHLIVPGLKRHQLIPPVENLEDRMCRKHDKPLELFCKTDHTCICVLCPVLDHKNHEFVPLKDEHEEQKAELKKTEAKIHQMIQERQLKIQEIQRSVELSNNAADRETAEGVEVFTALIDSVQRSLNQFKEKIQEKQRTTEKQAEGFVKELKQEICELKKRSTEVEQLLDSKDHFHFVQRFTCVKAAPSMRTWTKVSIRPPSYEGTVVRAVSQLENKLTEDMKTVVEAELKRVQQYEVDLTLDPDTAHPGLILSDDGKQVHYRDKWKNLPDKPQRFSFWPCILAKQSFSSGRFYYEVQVKGKTQWYLGVVRKSINRKGRLTLRPQSGYWTICLTNGNLYIACADPLVRLSVKSGPQKVGVFVDYEEGLVSFYDVGSSVLIYSFTGCCFNDKLLPFFSPRTCDGGKNSAPLIITPVDTE